MWWKFASQPAKPWPLGCNTELHQKLHYRPMLSIDSGLNKQSISIERCCHLLDIVYSSVQIIHQKNMNGVVVIWNGNINCVCSYEYGNHTESHYISWVNLLSWGIKNGEEEKIINIWGGKKASKWKQKCKKFERPVTGLHDCEKPLKHLYEHIIQNLF